MDGSGKLPMQMVAPVIPPRVLNVHHDVIPARSVNIRSPSVYANPFEGKFLTHDEDIDAFEKWFDTNFFLKDLVKKALRGRSLVCTCAPARCHGDILLKVANQPI